jgi:hypothetical protein
LIAPPHRDMFIFDTLGCWICRDEFHSFINSNPDL